MADDLLGCPYPLFKTSRGYLPTQKGVDVIKSDLLQLLLTNPGERCLAGDTTIALVTGQNIEIQQLLGTEFWVYAFDTSENRIVPAKATAHKTISNAEVVSVELDNKEIVTCTPDHLWLLRDGSWLRADELTVGTSLMPLYRCYNTSGYERIYQPYLGDYIETHRSFVVGTRQVGLREVIHHKDLNKYNNAPDNLEWMTWNDHRQLHKEINNAFIKKIQSDEVFRNNWITKLTEGIRKYYETHSGSRCGVILTDEAKQHLSDVRNAYYQSEKGKETKDKLRETALVQFETLGHPSLGRTHTNEAKEKMKKSRPSITGDNNPAKRPDVREKISNAAKARYEKQRIQKNHKVTAITKCTEKMDCYDLSVKQYHNFGLSAGVFVHNCMMPEFGCNLRQFFFEPADEILVDQVRQVIIEALEAWEPRIAVTDITVSANSDEQLLTINIQFRHPEDIKQVEDLKIELPVNAGG